MKEQPPPKSLKLLKYLVKHFLQTKVDLDKPDTILTYGKNSGTLLSYSTVLMELGYPNDQGTHGRSLNEHAGMDGFCIWLRKKNLPAITGIIVKKDTLRPSYDFYKDYRKDCGDDAWLKEEIKKACELDWKKELAKYGISLDT